MFHSSACCSGTKSTGMSKIMPCILLPRTAHILVVSVIIWADDSQVHLTSPTCKAELAAHIPNCLPLASLPRKCYIKARPQLQHPPFNHPVPTPWYYASLAAEAQHMCVQCLTKSHLSLPSGFRFTPSSFSLPGRALLQALSANLKKHFLSSPNIPTPNTPLNTPFTSLYSKSHLINYVEHLCLILFKATAD